MKTKNKKWTRTLAKWASIVLGSIILIVLSVYIYSYYSVKGMLEKDYFVDNEVINITYDNQTFKKGRHQAHIRGCVECHGSGLQGKIMLDDPILGRITSPNLTKGKGGLTSYKTEDWVRALKHGVKKNNKAIPFMPSNETCKMTEKDMADLIAYCETLTPVDNEVPGQEMGALLYVLGAFKVLDVTSTEKIDHNAPFVTPVKTEDPLENGKYLTVLCSGCHKENLKGGDPIAPGFPPVPDITSSGHPGKWTLEQFTHTLRTGQTPEGKTLLNDNMPWKITAQYSDYEISSIYAYIQTLK